MIIDCPHSVGVSCAGAAAGGRHCGACGWNPDAAEAHKITVRAQYEEWKARGEERGLFSARVPKGGA